MLGHDLSKLDIVVLILDGAALCQGLCNVVAIGINNDGSMHVLGFKVDSSKNSQVCADLMADLRRHGLESAKGSRFLAILDGAKALTDAILEMYPGTLTQRCLVHKERNLRGYLSKRVWAKMARLFRELRKPEGKDGGHKNEDWMKEPFCVFHIFLMVYTAFQSAHISVSALSRNKFTDLW